LPNSKDPAVRPRADERERRACELRLGGLTYAEIGAQLGVTAMGAYKAYIRVLRRIPEKAATLARQEALERFDRMRCELWRVIETPNIPDKALVAAINTLLKIETREAKLLGLDARH
jgi:hypothetical protein